MWLEATVLDSAILGCTLKSGTAGAEASMYLTFVDIARLFCKLILTVYSTRSYMSSCCSTLSPTPAPSDGLILAIPVGVQGSLTAIVIELSRWLAMCTSLDTFMALWVSLCGLSVYLCSYTIVCLSFSYWFFGVLYKLYIINTSRLLII